MPKDRDTIHANLKIALRDTNFKLPPEVHALVKAEAATRRKTMKSLFIDCVITYLNVYGSKLGSGKERFESERDLLQFWWRIESPRDKE
jgi:hypothetical protein